MMVRYNLTRSNKKKEGNGKLINCQNLSMPEADYVLSHNLLAIVRFFEATYCRFIINVCTNKKKNKSDKWVHKITNDFNL